jgi:electron transport complex protein RnfA
LTHYSLLFLGALLVYNIILIRFFALCSFFGVSNRMSTSVGMGFAVIFVMVVSSAISWVLFYYILQPLGVGIFLYIPTFILVIATLVQFEELFIKKYSPTLYQAMGIYLPLITTNCAVLAAATESVVFFKGQGGFLKMNIVYSYTFPEAVVYTLGVSVGFAVIICVFAGMRERIDIAPVPKWLRGPAISFIAASMMSLAFMGFSNLFHL